LCSLGLLTLSPEPTAIRSTSAKDRIPSHQEPLFSVSSHEGIPLKWSPIPPEHYQIATSTRLNLSDFPGQCDSVSFSLQFGFAARLIKSRAWFYLSKQDRNRQMGQISFPIFDNLAQVTPRQKKNIQNAPPLSRNRKKRSKLLHDEPKIKLMPVPRKESVDSTTLLEREDPEDITLPDEDSNILSTFDPSEIPPSQRPEAKSLTISTPEVPSYSESSSSSISSSSTKSTDTFVLLSSSSTTSTSSSSPINTFSSGTSLVPESKLEDKELQASTPVTNPGNNTKEPLMGLTVAVTTPQAPNPEQIVQSSKSTETLSMPSSIPIPTDPIPAQPSGSSNFIQSAFTPCENVGSTISSRRTRRASHYKPPPRALASTTSKSGNLASK